MHSEVAPYIRNEIWPKFQIIKQLVNSITPEFAGHQRKVLDIWYELNIIEREIKLEQTSRLLPDQEALLEWPVKSKLCLSFLHSSVCQAYNFLLYS